MNPQNPWTKTRLEQYIGREEDQTLEVKSTRDLATGDKGKIDTFFLRKVAREVSAFLNSEGGLLILGMEEGKEGKRDIVTGLSLPGIPRSALTAKQAHDKVFGLINPPAADLVQVYPVDLEGDGDNPLLAFVVDVKRGNTAYQSAPDKIYYVRRGSSSDPMDDKDIRLRMLADDKPRISISGEVNADREIGEIRKRLQQLAASRRDWIERRDRFLGTTVVSDDGKNAAIVEAVGWPPDIAPLPAHWQVWLNYAITNTGYVTIRELARQVAVNANDYVRYSVGGITDDSDDRIEHWVFDRGVEGDLPIFPEGRMTFSCRCLTVSRDIDPSQAELSLRIKVFLDNGRASETVVDLSEEFRTCIQQLRDAENLPLGSDASKE